VELRSKGSKKNLFHWGAISLTTPSQFENGQRIGGGRRVMKPRESFIMHPSDLLEEELNLLGIPWENA